MELLSIIMLSFAACFTALIVGLVFFNVLVMMGNSEQSKVLDKQRKSFGLTKERSERISIKTQQAYLDKYPTQGAKCDHVFMGEASGYPREIDEVREKYLETLPSHKTRVALRKKRKSKQEK